MIILSRAALAAGLFILSGSAVLAHASISPKEAANGSSIKLAVTVPHGCDGAPTDAVIIKLPEGFVSAKPQVKAGWTVEITKGDYQQAYEVHGSPVTSGALEVKWSGGSIPDDQFDEFVVQGSLMGFAGETSLPINITQLCGAASVVWDQVAAEGQDAHALKYPAPSLKVTVAEAAAEHDHMLAMPAGPVVLGDLEISGGFTRATLPNAPVGGGFLTIVNTGTTDDRLVSATTTVSGVTQIHEMKMEGDVMKMAELPEGLPIPAGETVTLQPGGFHLMFMELKEPLVEGTQVPVTLTFEKAGTVEVLLDVGGIGAKEPVPAMHGDASGHDAHGNGAAMDMSGMSDLDAIAAMQKAMFDKPDSPLTMGPVVVVGEYAVSDWAQQGTGGRALLRKTASGWAIHLCSGAGLKDAMELAKIGVPHDIAHELAAQLSTAEMSVAPDLLKQFDAFDGVMMIDDSLI